jgi:hypothetical protein
MIKIINHRSICVFLPSKFYISSNKNFASIFFLEFVHNRFREAHESLGMRGGDIHNITMYCPDNFF